MQDRFCTHVRIFLTFAINIIVAATRLLWMTCCDSQLVNMLATSDQEKTAFILLNREGATLATFIVHAELQKHSFALALCVIRQRIVFVFHIGFWYPWFCDFKGTLYTFKRFPACSFACFPHYHVHTSSASVFKIAYFDWQTYR